MWHGDRPHEPLNISPGLPAPWRHIGAYLVYRWHGSVLSGWFVPCWRSRADTRRLLSQDFIANGRWRGCRKIFAAVERQGCSTISCCVETDATSSSTSRQVSPHHGDTPASTKSTYGIGPSPQDGSTHGSNGPRWRSNARRTWALICVCETCIRFEPVPRDGPDRTGLHMTQNTVRPT